MHMRSTHQCNEYQGCFFPLPLARSIIGKMAWGQDVQLVAVKARNHMKYFTCVMYIIITLYGSSSVLGQPTLCDRIWENPACRDACAIILIIIFGHNIAKLVFVELW